MASEIKSFRWVADDINEHEQEAVQRLVHFATFYDAAFGSLINKAWVHDGLNELEAAAVEDLYWLADDDQAIALRILDMPWVADEVEYLEARAINWVNNFKNVEVASLVVALSWMEDGIEELEVKTIQELSYIDYDDAGLAATVVALRWVQDGITAIEAETIHWFSNFSDAEAALAIVALDWVREGIGKQEALAIEELSYLSRKNGGHVEGVVGMPFLATLDPPDISALESLVDMAWFRQADFQRVLSHPTLSAGITDDWAKIVATLYGVSKNNPDLIDTLLDPEQVSIEERTIVLPIAGETLLTIIRTGPGAERSMDLLEHAVRHTEEYMATSFPTGYVGWLFGDAVTPSFAGTNFGTHIASLSQYDVDDGSDDAKYAGRHSAHEVAHYYWRDNNNWVDEGIANFMEYVSENARTGQPIEVTEYPCGYLRTIAELEALEVTSEEGEDSVFTCNYALGERLFLDLYRNLDEEDFRQGLRALYVLSQTVQEGDAEDDAEIGIEHVKIAFKDVEGVDDQVVDMITARWYDGTEAYDTSAKDTQPTNPAFRTVSGRIDVAYLAASHGGSPVTSISAGAIDDWLQVYLDYSYSVGSDNEVPLEIVVYYEDGFVFDRRTVSFTAEPGFIGGSWWLSVGASPSERWAPGQYRVYIYNEGRKLVELEYEVTE